MSQLFDRIVRVEVQTRDSLHEIAPVRTQFQVRKTRGSEPNEMMVRLFNLAEGTRKQIIEVGATVRLFAGYGGVSQIVGQAQTTRATIEHSLPDAVAVLDCLDGINELRGVRVSLSFDNGATVRQVIDAIASRLGVPVRPIEIDLGVPIRGGYSHVGGVGRALDDMVKRVRGSWSVQNGDLLILGPSGSTPSEATLLSPSTGLLYSPAPIDDALSSDRIGGAARAGWRITALLQPQIEPGDRVRIESRDVDGVFAVDEIEHRGDTRGPEFTSAMVIYE